MSRNLILSVLFGSCLGIVAQTRVDLQNQSRGVDFSAAPYTKPAKTGAVLPPACSTGEAYVLTSAAPGSNFFICTATNTWTRQGSSGTSGVNDHSQLTHLDYSSSGHTGFQPALGYTPIDSSSLGLPSGPARLGSDGKVLASELPSTSGGSGGTSTISFATDQVAGNGSQFYTLTGTPVAGSLIVAVNGQVQEPGAQADYTLAGSAVTFNAVSVPPSGSRISFRYGTAAAGTVTPDIGFATDQATGDGARYDFALSGTPLAGSLTVSVNGQIQEAGALADYASSGNTVSFKNSSIPPSGARISFRYGFSPFGGDGKILLSQLPAGVPNGLASLGGDGKVLPAQLPAAPSGGGGLSVSGYYLTDGTRFYCGSTFQSCTKPTLANFTNLNIAGATASTEGGAVTISVPESTGNGYHGLSQARGTNTTLIAHLLCDIDESNCAIGFSDGAGNGHVLAFYAYAGPGAPSLGVSIQYVAGNGYAGMPASRWTSIGSDIWVKATVNGPNCDLSTSLTGQNWRLIDSRACYVTPTHFMVAGQDGGARRGTVVTVLSWQLQ